MVHVLAFLALVALFTAADFLTGRDYCKRLGLPGRSIWYTGAIVTGALAIAGAVHGDPVGWASIGVGWAFWRGLFGWSSFGGSMNPQTASETIGEAIRNIVSSLFPMIAAAWMTSNPHRSVVAMLCFALWATAVAIWFGVESRKGRDVDPWVDALHGAGFGVALGVLLAS